MTIYFSGWGRSLATQIRRMRERLPGRPSLFLAGAERRTAACPHMPDQNHMPVSWKEQPQSSALLAHRTHKQHQVLLGRGPTRGVTPSNLIPNFSIFLLIPGLQLLAQKKKRHSFLLSMLLHILHKYTYVYGFCFECKISMEVLLSARRVRSAQSDLITVEID